MGNREKTQRPLPITPLREGKSTVRKRGPPPAPLSPPSALSQGAPWMPGPQCAPVSIPLSRDGVSHGDLQHPHWSLHVANTEEVAQPCHSPVDSPGGGGAAQPLSPAEIMGEGVAASQLHLQVAVVLLAPHLENSGRG